MADELTMDSGALIFATLADVYLSSGMIDEAISILKDGLSRNPTYTLAKIILGRAYYMKSDIPQAIKVLEEARAEVPNSENANLYLGHSYKKMGEAGKAVEFYKTTLEINPDNREAQQELQSMQPEEVETVPPAAPSVVEVPSTPMIEEVPPTQEEILPAAEGSEAAVEVPAESTPSSMETEPESTSEPSPEAEPAVEEQPEREEPPAPEDTVITAPYPPDESAAAVGEAAAEPADTGPAEKAPAEAFPAAETEVTEEPAVTEEVPESRVEEQTTFEETTTAATTPMSADTATITPPATGEVMVPFASLKEPVSRLLAMKSVKGAFICSPDGLLIQNYYQEHATIEELCAMVAAIHNEANEAFRFLEEGVVDKFIIEKGDETVCVITAGESLLVVITKAEAKPGLVFIYARKIIEEIREILG